MQICVNTSVDRVLAIDPGPKLSAYLILDGGVPTLFAKIPNDTLLDSLRSHLASGVPTLACEMIQARGMGVSADTFDTVFWAGRYCERWMPGAFVRVFRSQVKAHICGQQKAKDSNIRIALIDKFGGADIAIGGKKCPKCKGKMWIGRDHAPCTCDDGWLYRPGPLHGLAADCWSALAIAVTWRETMFRTAASAQRSPESTAAAASSAVAASAPDARFGFRSPTSLSGARPS